MASSADTDRTVAYHVQCVQTGGVTGLGTASAIKRSASERSLAFGEQESSLVGVSEA